MRVREYRTSFRIAEGCSERVRAAQTIGQFAPVRSTLDTGTAWAAQNAISAARSHDVARWFT